MFIHCTCHYWPIGPTPYQERIWARETGRTQTDGGGWLMRAGYPPILLLFFVSTWVWCWTTKIGTCKDTAGTCRCWFQAFVIYAQLWSWTTNQPTGLEHMFAECIQIILRLLFSLSAACKSSVKTSPAAAFRKMGQLRPTSRKTMVPGVFPMTLDHPI